MVNAPESTNTLILVPKCSAGSSVPSSASLYAALRPLFEKCGNLRIWAPLLGLGRLVAIYQYDEEAAEAKLALDRSVIEERPSGRQEVAKEGILLRVYAAPRTPEALLVHPSLQRDAHLPVPVSDKNFLISPPGSPPVGWEQIREDPPNADTLADDLMRALECLGPQYGPDDEILAAEDGVNVHISSGPTSPRVQSPRDTLIVAAPEDDSLPSVLVSDLDGQDYETGPQSGLTIANTPNGIRRPPTPRPPGSITAVKATVESMVGSKITPTARPPMNGF